ncbi:MAG: hypothetical protein MK134_12930, partial [Dehalococcoidia bacterium]|nr:hypothetical protein [Dehalococcoidia bacterium]
MTPVDPLLDDLMEMGLNFDQYASRDMVCKRQSNTVALGRSRGSAERRRGALGLTRGGLWSNDGISHQEGHERCEGKSVHRYGDVDGSPPPRAEQGTQQASGL